MLNMYFMGVGTVIAFFQLLSFFEYGSIFSLLSLLVFILSVIGVVFLYVTI